MTAEIASGTVDSVRIVTSTSFDVVAPGQEQLVESDTLVVPLPHTEQEDISASRRYLIRVFPADTAAAEAPVSLQVRVDGEVRFDEESDIRDTPLRFTLVFRGNV